MIASQLVTGIGTLPLLPDVVFRLQGILSDDRASLGAVARLVEKDPSLTARLLQAANSAFFGVRSEIRTVEHALVVLGSHMVRNLLLVTTLHGTLRRFRLPAQFSMVRFWEHSLVTAVLSKVLSTRASRFAPDEAFVGGLLHDVGKVALATLFPDERSAVLASSAFSDRELERGLFGVNHVEVGAALATHWRLPTFVAEVIRYHHEPAAGPALARVVHAADLFAHYLFPGRKEQAPFHQIPQYVAEQMAVPVAELEDVAAEAKAALAEAHAIATG